MSKSPPSSSAQAAASRAAMASHPEFAGWLAHKSWSQGVGFCKAAALLIPAVALSVDVPMLFDPARRHDPSWIAMALWHIAAELVVLGAVWVNSRPVARRHTQACLTGLAAAILVLTTLIAIINWTIVGDLSMFALGAVFVATVLCTPRPVRHAMYFAGVALIFAFIVFHVNTGQDLLNAMVNPVSIAIVAVNLDRYTYFRNVELFAEKQRAEHERARADKVLYNVLPTSIADELKANERVNAVRFDGMGVMFTDLVGFTNYSSSLPPQSVVKVLDDIFSRFDHLVDRHSLEKIKTIGDAYMAVSQRRTADLAELALDMLDAIDAYNAEHGTAFRLRIGLHVGPAVAGVIGVKRFLYDVWGDTVNVASRMESGGEPGRVHVTEAVRDELLGQFAFEERGGIEVKGKGRMTTYFLARPVGRGAAEAAAAQAGLSAFRCRSARRRCG
ncbi:adenylate/guanylate cyclase domain-containing protein [Ramlibacter humi]|uniref:Adenylate/guanylate cyclase domain-containing protein n=1 Tax=Ramlibacter humi TaxID=2530451 RepID=A0A4Z0BVE6_9BURK|nr:adenylate/guanylate cyclase domain-containing protein [Ramlibacter humi]TFZ02005.1 adenylate/guanylate cyclase domain-containing protein [Ramlibacter humi]